MLNWLAVMIGGSIGSGTRYGLSLFWLEKAPLGTFLANVMGSFLLAILTCWTLSDGGPQSHTRLLLTTGLCGGFTTFSTFNLETLRMFEDGHLQKGALYLITTLLTCLFAGGLGLWLGKLLFLDRTSI